MICRYSSTETRRRKNRLRIEILTFLRSNSGIHIFSVAYQCLIIVLPNICFLINICLVKLLLAFV